MSDAIVRDLAEFLVEVASNDTKPVAHGGSCGDRVPAPCGAHGPTPLPAERRRNGWVDCHLCGKTLRPSEPVVCGRRPVA